ncbi:hypothetical protein F4820DRAFT_451451 [Hypoxylon rubiginosum]|uniref:Uncharacterized protein n=1 Tax=Hypoxylon rubiginosum TaxID=110542 RepID=A0ACB9YSA4_9PEZI|nr:hypothetical protein F4820DRAFT_451451 [Hypoxylon rubiginosum]
MEASDLTLTYLDRQASTATYNSRLEWVQSLNFGGTSDWAMDLETSYYGNGSEVRTGSGVVYIDPSVLTDPDATIACEPPCTFVLPPWILSTSTVITQPPITETILEMYPSVQTLNNGVTSTVYVSVTTVTTITLPPVTTDMIDLPGPYPEADPTTKPGPPPGPPPREKVGSVHVTSGKPKPTCVSGCGSLCGFNCKPEIPCIGICGCIGFGCPAGGSCLGPGCGSGTDSDGGDDNPEHCSTTYTVTNCQIACSITDFGTSVTTTCFSTSCVTVPACSETGFTTTPETITFACPWTTALASAIWTPSDPDALPPPTTFIDCNFHGQDPDQGVTAQYCVCSGSTFPASSDTKYPGESCPYTKLPTQTTAVSTLKEVVTTSNCQVCTYAGLNADCTTINGCTPTTTVKSTSTVTLPDTTVTVTPTADCAFWDEGWGYRFEIYKIAYWATDGGKKLHNEENGCAGCIERAIVSAGGPKISCKGQGLDIQKRIDGIGENEADGFRPDREKRAAMTVAASYLPPSSIPTYTYATSMTSTPRYTPMTWVGTDTQPVILTPTIMSEEVVVFTNVVPFVPTATR